MTTRYITGRLAQAVIALFVLSLLVFFLSRMTGDPVQLLLPIEATQEDRALVSHELGFDKPLYVQYVQFIAHAARGDLGTSLKGRVPVADLLRERLPNTATLAIGAILLALVLAIPLGVLSAVKKGGPVSLAATVIAVLGQSLPAFWVGLLLMELFAVRLRWLPAGGIGGLSHYVLPIVTLSLFLLAGITRLLRSSMMEVMDTEYIKLARIKGVSENQVVWKHALRAALLPVIGFAGMYLAILLTGAVVIEVVFAWPGVGSLAYDALMFRDFPLVQGVFLLMGTSVIVINLFVDLLYMYLDPRIKLGR